MVSQKSVDEQLKNIHFNPKSWGKAEVTELPNILLDDEKIFECVNGLYEGGFALLVATNIRLLLIDKKPLKFLTVEDLRFDMINQIDYSHRLMGASINISTGNKNLKFSSYNQQRLRKLINHIQHRMAEVKQQVHSSAETQQQHLERINQQLQAYLLAQHQQQEQLRMQLQQADNKQSSAVPAIEPVRPAPELADFLYAQSLLQHHEALNGTSMTEAKAEITEPPAIPAPMLDASMLASAHVAPAPTSQPVAVPVAAVTVTETDSLVEAGRREIFGARARAAIAKPLQSPLAYLNTEINPLRVAYAKLPLVLRQRKYNRAIQRAAAKDAAATAAANASAAITGATQIASA